MMMADQFKCLHRLTPITDADVVLEHQREAQPAVRVPDPEDLSRFEAEGRPEAPLPATALIDVPLENAVWRDSPWAAHEADRNKITP